jgi:hypothetical protein
MPAKKTSLLLNLSTADLKRLLAARERIDVLEVEKTRLVKELAKVENELTKLMAVAARAGSGGPGKASRKKAGKKVTKKPGRKKTRRKTAGKKSRRVKKTPVKKVTRKKAAGKKKTKKKVVRKKAAGKKMTKKKVVRKKTAGKKVTKKKVMRKKKAGKKKAPVRKPTTRKAGGSGKMKLEDVIVAVIKKNGSPVPFQTLKTKILAGKLFKTKSGNFDNVLRRTLSTSKAVKRVGRGVYDIA